MSTNDSALTTLLERMRRAGTMLDPTLLVMMPGEAPADTSPASMERVSGPFRFNVGMARRAVRMGIPIVAGTDGIGGSTANLHAELQLLVDSVGLTPLQAIRAATLNGAIALGLQDSLGTVSPGKIADLVVMRRDPARSIRNTQTISMVMKGGRAYPRSEPMKVGPYAKPPASGVDGGGAEATDGASVAFPEQPSNDLRQKISRVEAGLQPELLIVNRAPSGRWDLRSRMEHHAVAGLSVAVIDNYAVSWAKGYGVTEAGGGERITPATLFQAGSISKPVSAVVALALAERGLFSLDQDVNEVLRSWKIPASAFTKTGRVTVRRLLSHSASVTVDGFDGYVEGGLRPTLRQVLDGEWPANSAPVRVDGEPGTSSRYSGGGFVILQQLLEDVSGAAFDSLARATVFLPAQLKRSTFAPVGAGDNVASGHRSDGSRLGERWHVYPEQTAASLWSTPLELSAFIIQLQRTYEGSRGGMLTPESVRQMLTPQIGDAGLGIFLKADTATGSRGTLRFSHTGSTEGYNSIMIGYLRGGRGVVVMTNSDRGGDLAMEVVRSVAREYGWPDLRPTTKVVAEVDVTRLERFTGEYASQSGPVYRVRVERGQLFFGPLGRPALPLLAESESRFFLEMPGVPTVEFVSDPGAEPSLVYRRGPMQVRATRR